MWRLICIITKGALEQRELPHFFSSLTNRSCNSAEYCYYHGMTQKNSQRDILADRIYNFWGIWALFLSFMHPFQQSIFALGFHQMLFSNLMSYGASLYKRQLKIHWYLLSSGNPGTNNIQRQHSARHKLIWNRFEIWLEGWTNSSCIPC